MASPLSKSLATTAGPQCGKDAAILETPTTKIMAGAELRSANAGKHSKTSWPTWGRPRLAGQSTASTMMATTSLEIADGQLLLSKQPIGDSELNHTKNVCTNIATISNGSGKGIAFHCEPEAA